MLRAPLRAPWLIFVDPTPRCWRTIKDVRLEQDQIVLVEDNDHLAIPARGVVRFLEATAETPEATVS